MHDLVLTGLACESVFDRSMNAKNEPLIKGADTFF